MADVLHFYIDDSGTRRPDHKFGKKAAHGHEWFALGGILVKQEDEPEARRLHRDFLTAWPKIATPLHSVEIRGRTGGFLWLEDLSQAERERFYESLYQLMREVPVIGLACVIDRPGYSHRYLERYGRQPWRLCKTAFGVSVERAAKYAHGIGYKLKVMPERCNKPDDALLRGYYDDLRASGMPFAGGGDPKYAPLSSRDLGETLYDFRLKAKSSPMAQLADLYLWPICIGGYHASNRTYARLLSDGKLIECLLPEEDWDAMATKYSCFDLVQRKP